MQMCRWLWASYSPSAQPIILLYRTLQQDWDKMEIPHLTCLDFLQERWHLNLVHKINKLDEPRGKKNTNILPSLHHRNFHSKRAVESLFHCLVFPFVQGGLLSGWEGGEKLSSQIRLQNDQFSPLPIYIIFLEILVPTTDKTYLHSV